MIKTEIKHYRWKHTASEDEQRVIDELVNNALEPIMLDCVAYKARVIATITESGNYKIEAVCDQYSTLARMQDLLPELIPDFK